MVDTVTAAKRSEVMAKVGSKDTRPELIVRRGLHARGFRYRLHDAKLPGKPDLVFPRYKAVIFVNGCFWHGHDCGLYRFPKSNTEYWTRKISGNVTRDREHIKRLRELGWRVLNIWECALKGKARLQSDEILHAASTWLRGNSTVHQIAGAWE